MTIFSKKKLTFKVGFIICGTQKGGTTALDYYLRLHNQICMAKKKEVHFFDEDKFFKIGSPNYSYYHSFFKPHQNHKIIGEATPIYMYWENTIKRIYHYNRNMKLIIVLRNPADRAFSHWNMETHRKRENRSFWEAINEEMENDAKTNKQHRTYSYVGRGFYSRQITEILKYFNKNQLLTIRNSNLRNDPNKILKKVTKFLSISDFTQIEHKEVHSTSYKTTLNNKENEFLYAIYKKEIQKLENLLKWDLASWKR